jgi:hypothetical protein
MTQRPPWDPWTAIAVRGERLVAIMYTLPRSAGGGLYWPLTGHTGVFVDSRCSPAERRCVLAHELLHDERNGGRVDPDEFPSGAPRAAWREVVMREEHWIDEAVAARLVPRHALAAMRRATPALVAARFGVSREYAIRAIRQLDEWRGRQHRPPKSGRWVITQRREAIGHARSLSGALHALYEAHPDERCTKVRQGSGDYRVNVGDATVYVRREDVAVTHGVALGCGCARRVHYEGGVTSHSEAAR